LAAEPGATRRAGRSPAAFFAAATLFCSESIRFVTAVGAYSGVVAINFFHFTFD
jgi:hypothetical protein